MRCLDVNVWLELQIQVNLGTAGVLPASSLLPAAHISRLSYCMGHVPRVPATTYSLTPFSRYPSILVIGGLAVFCSRDGRAESHYGQEEDERKLMSRQASGNLPAQDGVLHGRF